MNRLPISRRKPHTHTRRRDYRPGGVLTQIHVEYLRSAELVVPHDHEAGGSVLGKLAGHASQQEPLEPG
jgi:hypothetical protein